jgi:HlyD family secretion protein
MTAQSDSEAADLLANAEQLTMKQTAIDIARAELHMAQANVENAEAVVRQKQAALEQAEVDLQRTVLRAPIDGFILKREVNPGQTVAVSFEAKTLFKIANDMREMEVDGRVDEADIGRVSVGQLVVFSVDAFPDHEFSGRVTQIRRSPEAVQNVVTYTVVVSAENPDLLLLPGMTATMRIEVSDSGVVLKVPLQALRFHPRARSATIAQPASTGDRGTVWVLGPARKPEPVSITLGTSDAGGAEVVAGALAEGQQVIVGVAAPLAGSGFGLRLGF